MPTFFLYLSINSFSTSVNSKTYSSLNENLKNNIDVVLYLLSKDGENAWFDLSDELKRNPKIIEFKNLFLNYGPSSFSLKKFM